MRYSKLLIFYNSRSGTQNTDDLKALLRKAAKMQGQKIRFADLTLLSSEQIGKEVRKAKYRHSLVVAAGGDGTVNSIARHCYEHNAALGIIPLGTFNYFARDLGIPTDPEKAIQLLKNGRQKAVAVGKVDKYIFLNNATFGLYTRLIREREHFTSTFGRLRLIAFIAAVRSLFQRQRYLQLSITSDKKEYFRNTSMVFIGNNTFQLTNLGLDVAKCTRRGKLAIVILKPTTHWDTARLLLRGIIRHWKKESRLEQFCAEQFKVESKYRTLSLVLDGEIRICPLPLDFKIVDKGLKILIPRGGKK